MGLFQMLCEKVENMGFGFRMAIIGVLTLFFFLLMNYFGNKIDSKINKKKSK